MLIFLFIRSFFFFVVGAVIILNHLLFYHYNYWFKIYVKISRHEVQIFLDIIILKLKIGQSLVYVPTKKIMFQKGQFFLWHCYYSILLWQFLLFQKVSFTILIKSKYETGFIHSLFLFFFSSFFWELRIKVLKTVDLIRLFIYNFIRIYKPSTKLLH